VNLAVEEVRRTAAKGCHSITFTENPAALGYPSYHDEYWDPLWTALVDHDVVLSVHLGSSGQLVVPAPNAPVDVMITLQPMNICQAAADLFWSRIPKHYPDLKIALTEGGIGWIPYFLERLERTYDVHSSWTGQDFGKQSPTEVFQRQFLTCFISDPVGVKNRHQIGIDNITWEMDYPHSDTSWPNPGEELIAECDAAGVTDAEYDKIAWENACRWYSWDPFAIRPKEKSTVTALRAESPGHDVSIKSMEKGRHTFEHQGTNLAELASKATA